MYCFNWNVASCYFDRTPLVRNVKRQAWLMTNSSLKHNSTRFRRLELHRRWRIFLHNFYDARIDSDKRQKVKALHTVRIWHRSNWPMTLFQKENIHWISSEVSRCNLVSMQLWQSTATDMSSVSTVRHDVCLAPVAAVNSSWNACTTTTIDIFECLRSMNSRRRVKSRPFTDLYKVGGAVAPRMRRMTSPTGSTTSNIGHVITWRVPATHHDLDWSQLQWPSALALSRAQDRKGDPFSVRLNDPKSRCGVRENARVRHLPARQPHAWRRSVTCLI